MGHLQEMFESHISKQKKVQLGSETFWNLTWLNFYPMLLGIFCENQKLSDVNLLCSTIAGISSLFILMENQDSGFEKLSDLYNELYNERKRLKQIMYHTFKDEQDVSELHMPGSNMSMTCTPSMTCAPIVYT